jgi:hypothetical protein
MTAVSNGMESTAAASATANDTPSFLRTYALTYAIGAAWLAAGLVVLGTQPKYGFGTVYVAALSMPPVFTAVSLLVLDRFGSMRTFLWRALALSLVATTVSVLSTVLLTPVLILMFREGVGHSLWATALLSAVSLVVASPLVIEFVAASRSQRWLHATVLVAGLVVVGVALSMALAPTGSLASAMRLDQGEILMITSSWWLPVYAVAAAFARRLGMA